MLQKVHAVHSVLFHRLQITYATNPCIDVHCIIFIYIYIHFIYISMSMHQCTENMEGLHSMIPMTWELIVAFFYFLSFFFLPLCNF